MKHDMAVPADFHDISGEYQDIIPVPHLFDFSQQRFAYTIGNGNQTPQKRHWSIAVSLLTLLLLLGGDKWTGY